MYFMRFEVVGDLIGAKARWLLFIPENSNLKDVLGDVNIPPDCEFLVAQKSGEAVELVEVYRVHATFSLQVHRVGNWSHDKGLQWMGTSLQKRRQNLHGLTLRTLVSEVRLAILRKQLTHYL